MAPFAPRIGWVRRGRIDDHPHHHRCHLRCGGGHFMPSHPDASAGKKAQDKARQRRRVSPQLDGTTGGRGRCHGGSQQCVPHGMASSSRPPTERKHTLEHTRTHKHAISEEYALRGGSACSYGRRGVSR